MSPAHGWSLPRHLESGITVNQINRATHRVLGWGQLCRRIAAPIGASNEYRVVSCGKFTLTRTIVFSSNSSLSTFVTYGSSLPEIRFFAFTHKCADCDAAHSEQRGLLCRR